MPNRLANETSPYLLQHKDNPVDWYPWGDEAFAESKRSGRPILLSVGYSACHWCHVMAHESFENADIAAQMNAGFVNIKVDREERPDVDAIYMQAVQALTGRGGWPMTVFLSPDGLPFYGGTYYPPDDRGGMPGFPRLLSAILDAYRNKPDDIQRAGRQLLDHLTASASLRPGDAVLSEAVLDGATDAVLAGHDREFGGFGRAPKFPQAMTLDFLMRSYHRTKRPEALEAVERTLTAMARGGMYDQVGGGFHRYSTDSVWLVPHFEKMLYDNALLARAYLDAWKLTGNAFYRRIVEETLDYVLREMTDASGGFYSTQDADSEGEEGRFFVWTPAQLEAVLGADAKLVGRYFGASAAGNFEGSNILHVPVAPERFAAENGLDLATFETQIADAKRRLYAAREQRVHPGLDDKVLAGWNGLLLRALAEAALAFDSDVYRDAAVRNADFLLESLTRDGRLLRSWKAGEAKLKGYLEDYAMLADGLLALYQATFETRFLREAIRLTDEMIDLFWDESVQGFYDTGRDHETLIARPRDLYDNATPSGSSVATDLLLRLAVLTDKADYERRAVAGLRTVVPFMGQAATAFGRTLSALDFHLARSQELALVWPEADAGRNPLLNVIRDAYLPNLLLVGSPEGEGGDVTPLLRDRPAQGGRPTAYLCERFVCQAPTTDPEELRHQLESTAS